jgi:predicted negative regulator of RcsB-dependent stress response
MSERTHRHQLEKNLLAVWLGEKIEILKPYSIPLTIGGLIVVAAIVGAVVYFARDNTGSARGWQTYFTAFGEPKVDEALKAAIDNPEVKGTVAELWARLAYADRQFGLAAFQAAQDPTEAKAALADAEKALLEIEGKTQDALLLERCRFSLARVYETQNKLNKAREYYGKVAESSKDAPVGKAAADAVKRLDPSSEVTQVITWLAEQKAPAKKPPGSGLDSIFDGMGPFGPGPTLPERPNLSLPGTESPFGAKGAGIDFGRNDPLGAKGTKPEGTTPGPNSPKTGDSGAKPGEGEKPTKEKPLDEKTPAEKPANSSKDADARPAESTTEKSVESKP